MQDIKFQIDFEKMNTDFQYYESVIFHQKENGRFCFSTDDRIKIASATRHFRKLGLLKAKHEFKNLAPFA
jgi:hypothetical protein